MQISHMSIWKGLGNAILSTIIGGRLQKLALDGGILQLEKKIGICPKDNFALF